MWTERETAALGRIYLKHGERGSEIEITFPLCVILTFKLCSVLGLNAGSGVLIKPSKQYT